MIRRRSLLRLCAGLSAGAAWSADLKHKDAARLQAAAIAIVVSGKPAEIAELGRQLADAAFLRRLDPGANDVTRLAEVFQSLVEHPSPATAALCLRVAQSKVFVATPSRWNLLLPALAAVRPMTAEAAQLFVKTGRSGFLEVNVPLLAANATPEALQAMVSLLADESQAVEQRVSAAHWGILPNRLRPGVVEGCAAILAKPGLASAVELAVIESLFDNRPAEWFGKRGTYPAPPPWAQATPTVRAAYRGLARTIRHRPNLPGHVRAAIDAAMLQVG